MYKSIFFICCLVIFSFANNITEIELNSYITNRISDEMFFENCDQAKYFVNNYKNSNKNNKIKYNIGSKGNKKCYIIKTEYRCPNISSNTFYYYSTKYTLDKIITIDNFIEACIDTTKFYIVKDRYNLLKRNEKEGIIILKIPELKSIKWKLYKEDEQ